MFDFIRSHSRHIMLLLAPLLILGFVMVTGQVGKNKTDASATVVATVAGSDITQAEWDAAHQSNLDRFRQQVPGMDLKFLDTPIARQQALDELVRERVMAVAALKAKLAISDERLLQAYRTDPEFAPFRATDGSIDRAKLNIALEQSRMTMAQLDARMREQMAARQVMAGVFGSVSAPSASASAALDAMFQQREVQIERFDSKTYVGKVAPTAADLEAYYNNPLNRAQFETPERADIEYVVLDMEVVKKSLQINPDEVRKYYDQNIKRYGVPEERRVKHILVKPESDDKREAAKGKAEALLAQLKKAPASFGEVAKAQSQDVGTAANGGEVDVGIARGDVDKAYEEALFALKPGQLSGVVDTKEGFYILSLVSVREGSVRSFDAVKSEIEATVRQSLAQVKFAEAVEEFSNLVYEQSDSLKPVVDKFKLEVQRAQGVTRAHDAKAEGPLSSEKFVAALFTNEVLANKRNTAAQQVKPNQWVAARVTRHVPSSIKPLTEVSAQVKDKVAAEQALALARKEGQARLAALRAAPATAMAGASLVVSRAQAKDLPRDAVEAVLKASSASLPAMVGVDLPDGYLVAKLTKVLARDPALADPKQAQTQYAQAWAAAEAQAYYTALKSRFKVEVKAKDLSKESAADASK